MKDFQPIFKELEEFKDFGRLNRWRLRKCLRTHFKKEAINNNYIRTRTNKLSYLNAAKVFSLRMRNNDLAMRVQSR